RTPRHPPPRGAGPLAGLGRPGVSSLGGDGKHLRDRRREDQPQPGRRQPAPPHRDAGAFVQRQRHLQFAQMSWGLVTEDWRLKLLGLGLAILMLGAVAFSQNPPTQKTLTVGINYTVPPNIVLINPPTKVNETYSGLARVIAQ